MPEERPDERLHDVADAGLELKELLVDLTSGAALAVPGEPLARPSTKTRRAAVVAALVVGVSALAGFLGYRSRNRTVPGAIRQPRFQLTLPRGVVIPNPDNASSRLAVSPDGERVAFVGCKEGICLLYVRDRRELDARPLPDTEGAICPFFSPDGRSLGFGANGKLKRITVDGGPVVTLAEAAQLRGGSWGEDGTILFTRGAGGLMSVTADDGEARALTQPDRAHDYDHRWPHLLPGGRATLFDVSHKDDSHDVALAELATENYVPSSRMPAARVTHPADISCSGGTGRSTRQASMSTVSPSQDHPCPSSKESSCGTAPLWWARRAGSCTTTWRERGRSSSLRSRLSFPSGHSCGSTAGVGGRWCRRPRGPTRNLRSHPMVGTWPQRSLGMWGRPTSSCSTWFATLGRE